MIVLDASVAVELLLKREHAQAIADRIADPAVSIHAPHLLTVEVVHVLRRYALTGNLPQERAHFALNDLVDLGVVLYSHEPLLGRMWQLCHSVTAYDAAYIALAEALDAELVTLDARLADSHGHSAHITLIKR